MKPRTVPEYIAAAPKPARAKLREMRALISAAAPGATQSLKWGMPAFSYQRILVIFGAFKRHIGFFITHVGRIGPFGQDEHALARAQHLGHG
jgi:uncharacterized protein YdhG (YjbR/CyaY superfamily)